MWPRSVNPANVCYVALCFGFARCSQGGGCGLSLSLCRGSSRSHAPFALCVWVGGLACVGARWPSAPQPAPQWPLRLAVMQCKVLVGHPSRRKQLQCLPRKLSLVVPLLLLSPRPTSSALALVASLLPLEANLLPPRLLVQLLQRLYLSLSPRKPVR